MSRTLRYGIPAASAVLGALVLAVAGRSCGGAAESEGALEDAEVALTAPGNALHPTMDAAKSGVVGVGDTTTPVGGSSASAIS